MKLWQKYLFSQLIPTFLCLLIGFWLLYIIIDLSIHGMSLFVFAKVSYRQGALYYLNQCIIFLDFFFPLTLLFSSLKILLDLNTHQELVAFQMAGISKKKLLSPFFIFALVLSFLSFLNTEYLVPSAHEFIDIFWSSHAKKKKKPTAHLHVLSLEDSSELFYQTYDPSTKELFDVFWIFSKEEIWHFETLNPSSLLAKKARHLFRKEQWRQIEFFDEKQMLELKLSSSIDRFIPFENRSITSLFRQMQSKLLDQPLKAHFFYKLLKPLLPLFVIFAIAPFSLHFRRDRSFYFLFGGALAIFFGFMTILDGMLLIGETSLLPPFVAIASPFLLVFLIFFRPFVVSLKT